MTHPDANAVWRAEANDKIIVDDAGSTVFVQVEGHEIARFLTWAGLVTKSDVGSAAETYAQQVREAYLALARGPKRDTPADPADADAATEADEYARPTVDGRPVVRVAIDVTVPPDTEADTIELIGEVLSERMRDNLEAVLGVNDLMRQHDVQTWWVRHDPTPTDETPGPGWQRYGRMALAPPLVVAVMREEPMVSVAWNGREIACVVIPAIGASAYDGYWSLPSPNDDDPLHRPMKASEFMIAAWRGDEARTTGHEVGDFVRLYRGTLPGAEDDGLDRLCPACGADILGDDPHGPDCPLADAD